MMWVAELYSFDAVSILWLPGENHIAGVARAQR